MTTDIGTSVGEFIDTATDNFVQNRFKNAFFYIGVFFNLMVWSLFTLHFSTSNKHYAVHTWSTEEKVS